MKKHKLLMWCETWRNILDFTICSHGTVGLIHSIHKKINYWRQMQQHKRIWKQFMILMVQWLLFSPVHLIYDPNGDLKIVAVIAFIQYMRWSLGTKIMSACKEDMSAARVIMPRLCIHTHPKIFKNTTLHMINDDIVRDNTCNKVFVCFGETFSSLR